MSRQGVRPDRWDRFKGAAILFAFGYSATVILYFVWELSK